MKTTNKVQDAIKATVQKNQPLVEKQATEIVGTQQSGKALLGKWGNAIISVLIALGIAGGIFLLYNILNNSKDDQSDNITKEENPEDNQIGNIISDSKVIDYKTDVQLIDDNTTEEQTDHKDLDSSIVGVITEE